MSYTQRGRRVAYDNIAQGAATGPERTYTDTVTNIEMHGGGTMTSTSTGDVNHTNIAVGVSVSDGLGPENMTVAVDPTDDNVATSNTVGAVTNP